MLRKMVEAKVGYVSPELYKEALAVAKADIKAHRDAGCKDFDTWSKPQQLEYVAFTMAVYIIMTVKQI